MQEIRWMRGRIGIAGGSCSIVRYRDRLPILIPERKHVIELTTTKTTQSIASQTNLQPTLLDEEDD